MLEFPKSGEYSISLRFTQINSTNSCASRQMGLRKLFAAFTASHYLIFGIPSFITSTLKYCCIPH